MIYLSLALAVTALFITAAHLLGHREEGGVEMRQEVYT